MCIVQRYALIGVAVLALIGWRLRGMGLAELALATTANALQALPKLGACGPIHTR
jgi:disulfide bond formation protein DsbB